MGQAVILQNDALRFVFSNIEPWWARLTNGFKSLGCRIRSVENEEENRSMHLQASLHLPQSVSRDHVLCVRTARTGRGHVIRSVANAGRPEDAYSCSLPRFQPTVYDSPGI